MERIKLCEKCNGSGEVDGYEQTGPHKKYGKDTCPRCGGSGRMIEKIKVETRPFGYVQATANHTENR